MQVRRSHTPIRVMTASVGLALLLQVAPTIAARAAAAPSDPANAPAADQAQEPGGVPTIPAVPDPANAPAADQAQEPRAAPAVLPAPIPTPLPATDQAQAPQEIPLPPATQFQLPVPAPVPVNPGRPYLVLSGGGARGAAHIGVIKVLEDLHVPVEMIVGTSMGSIVGGLYATGWSPEEMESLLNTIEWSKVFIDRVDRDEKSFRRKQDDSAYFIKAHIRFKGWKPYLPLGVLGGQRLELLLKSLQFESTGKTDFNAFPIPYRAVAADLTENVPYVLDHGSLADAMRASMSIAGAFPPVTIEGHVLVDGGAVANLPIGIAQQLGAKSLIAVDITSPLMEGDELGSFVSILSQMSGLLTAGNRVEDLKRLRAGDILIRPELGDISFSDFKKASEAVAIGEKAARAMAGELRKYAVGEEEWAAYMSRHHRRPKDELMVNRVEVTNESWVNDGIVEANLHVPTGKPFDRTTFSAAVMDLYGLDYFGVIRPTFEQAKGDGDLSLLAPSKLYGRNSLQLGFSFTSDFEGDSAADLRARHLLLAANRMGGEWRNTLQIGETLLAATEFYQPLNAAMNWFVVPSASWSRTTQKLWVDEEAIADYKITGGGARLDGGRVFGNWGDLQLGAFINQESGSVATGEPLLPSFSGRNGGLHLAFRVDTLDSPVFPTRGWRVLSDYSYSLESFGADASYRRATARALGAFSFGKNTIVPIVEVDDNVVTPVQVNGLFGLGGLWRLSGLARNEILGERAGLATVVYYRQLLKVGLGVLKTQIYAGASAETGNTYFAGQPVTLESLRASGSIFLGADTVIGPAYLACGFTEGGRRRYYFTIGQSF